MSLYLKILQISSALSVHVTATDQTKWLHYRFPFDWSILNFNYTRSSAKLNNMRRWSWMVNRYGFGWRLWSISRYYSGIRMERMPVPSQDTEFVSALGYRLFWNNRARNIDVCKFAVLCYPCNGSISCQRNSSDGTGFAVWS